MNPFIFSILFDLDNITNPITSEYTNEWYTFVMLEMTEQRFSDVFRMSRTQSIEISRVLYIKAFDICKEEFQLRLLLFILYISHKVVYRPVRELFKVSLSSAFRKINFIASFLVHVSGDFIKLPNSHEFNELASGFLNLAPYHGTILRIDGTHVRIEKPSLNGIKYFNRKKYYSLNVIIIVDFKQNIRFLTSGYGKNHDARIYRNSNNFQNYVEGLPRNYWVVGDVAFRSFDNIKNSGTI